ncbi:Hypothetical predicted protein [Podarcis lilfordi]|uniref:Uncharacterized protein n=1 Tax=Podarcis lilfordi TaxID=74358 RepID=A0AA35PF62_9SAUR|nr:Hypothetical predicted protein [Podarcis lilfordi]
MRQGWDVADTLHAFLLSKRSRNSPVLFHSPPPEVQTNLCLLPSHLSFVPQMFSFCEGISACFQPLCPGLSRLLGKAGAADRAFAISSRKLRKSSRGGSGGAGSFLC